MPRNRSGLRDRGDEEDEEDEEEDEEEEEEKAFWHFSKNKLK